MDEPHRHAPPGSEVKVRIFDADWVVRKEGTLADVEGLSRWVVENATPGDRLRFERSGSHRVGVLDDDYVLRNYSEEVRRILSRPENPHLSD